MKKHFILATAGHVDHGKSALIKALTGTDPDRLPEEKSRGITIELGFAQLELAAASSTISVGIIDVPGHEDFVKNMVAGVGSIDLALLVVAADDGWMPQTEEHLQILSYLGVKRAVVALTKIDLATPEDAAEQEVRTQLTGTVFQDAPIVRTSIQASRGIEELKAQLAVEFASLAPQPHIGKPRLAVDRAFTLRGIGTVVTGTLTGGTFRQGEAVDVQPTGIPARIRAIQSHNRELKEIGPGSRTALNLPNVTIARDKDGRGVWRGDVITLAKLGEANAVIDVVLTRSARLPMKTRPLKNGALVRVHHGSGNHAARIFFQSGNELPAREAAIAQMRFDEPVFLFAGDRFVVRDVSEQNTLGGGIVLDPNASSRNFRSAVQRQFLSKRAQSPNSAKIFVATQIVRDRAVKRNSLLIKSSFSENEIAESIHATDSVERGGFLIEKNWWSGVLRRAQQMVEVEHRTHPNHIGLPLSQLREVLVRDLPFPEIFDLLVSELCTSGLVRHGDAIALATHRPTLPPLLETAATRIRATLAAKNFDPPSRAGIAPDPTSQQALHFLHDCGETMELGGEVVLGTEQFGKMRDAIVVFLRKKNSASVSELRQLLGTSRRVIIPFLERLDRDGITRRIGDKRVLASES